MTLARALLLVSVLGLTQSSAQKGGSHPLPKIEIGKESIGKEPPGKGKASPAPEHFEVSAGVVIRDRTSRRTFGTEYAKKLRDESDRRYREFSSSPIDIQRLRILSLIDNSQTREAISDSSTLRPLTVEAPSATRQQLFDLMMRSQGKVIFLLTHLSPNGMIEASDGDISVQDLNMAAKNQAIPMLVVACRSRNFLPSGYTTLLNSLDMVKLIDGAVGSASSYGELLDHLATENEPLELDAEFLATTHDILKIRAGDGKGNERLVLYATGFPGTRGSPPVAAGLARVAVRTGWPYWLWRGLVYATAGLLFGFAADLFRPGAFKWITLACSLCFFYCILACFVVLAGASFVGEGHEMGWTSLIVLWVVFAVIHQIGDFGSPILERLLDRHQTSIGITGMFVIALLASAVIG